MKFLNIDSPLMQGLGKMADLMWLNVLTLICCIPIVTIGASLTAMNYMALKIARNEECYITKGFFKSFKENFRQATLIWLILFVVMLVLVGDFFIMRSSGIEFSNIFRGVLIAIALLVVFTALYVFPVLAKFENTVFRTIKNAFMMSVMQFPKTILMMILYLIPLAVFLFVIQLMPLSLLFGLSAPAWCSAKLYNKLFKRLEDQITAANDPAEPEEAGEDERIFKDELDPVLAEGDAAENRQ
ncbi:MAG: DUF624 domain-containing protein [Roseburia sp.]|nr:DUF624 domain-containing protein [Roseburia sp.]MCM1098289.1 DUF624 domain-containing protein [Ruminococcus flavefaciens]